MMDRKQEAKRRMLDVLAGKMKKEAGDRAMGHMAVKVASDSPEGLKKGLEKAKEVIEEKLPEMEGEEQEIENDEEMPSAEEELEEGIEDEKEHYDVFKQIIEDAKNNQLKPLEEYAKGVASKHLEHMKNYYSMMKDMEEHAKEEESEEY